MPRRPPLGRATGFAVAVVATATVATGCSGSGGSEPEPGNGSGARPVSECPTELDGTFEVVGTFPVKAPGVPLAISGDRVAFADANGSSSYDVRLVGLSGASAPNLDELLLEGVRPLPIEGEVAGDYAPLQLAAARDGIVTAHGAGGDVVVTRFDRAGFRVWEQTVPRSRTTGEVHGLDLVGGVLHLRYSDIDDYPGTYGAQELSYATGELGDYREANDQESLDAELGLGLVEPQHTWAGGQLGPPVSVPDATESVAEGQVRCGDVAYTVDGVQIGVGEEEPVTADTVPEVVRHAGKGDGGVLGVTPDAVWVGWRDFASGDGALFALRY